MKMQYTSIAGAPFCDYLTVTMAASMKDSLNTSLSPLLDMAGLSTFDSGETYQIDNSPGALKIKSNPRYITISASGGILKHFRELGVFDEYIAILSEYPLKITRLDATADYYVENAPHVIQSFKKLAMASKIDLTRKALGIENVNTYMGTNEHGQETGTIYLGKRDTHSVYGKIYDKTHERISKGYAYQGQIVRVELTLKADTGISLRDAHNPENVYYNYASRSIVSPPPHYIGWEPNSTGFKLEKQQELFTPAGKILNIFKHSPDIGRAIRIGISEFGDEALDVLISLFRIAFLKRQQSII